MSARAGILVTGTEVLTGRVRDRNGPWLADRLNELGVDLAHTLIVGDRKADIEAALGFMANQGLDLVITSGGLGPTADDLTVEAVAGFQGREMALDRMLEARIGEIVRPLSERYPKLDGEAIAAGTRKQATVPVGARVLDPVGTAPGLVVGPAEGKRGPTIVVLPGPPRELQPMWRAALDTQEMQSAVARATTYTRRVLRLFGIPESEIAETLRAAERSGVALERLEITTCLRGGEIEVLTRYEPDAQDAYEAFARIVEERHRDTLFSRDGSSVDEQVASLLRGDPSAQPIGGPADDDRGQRDGARGHGGHSGPFTIGVAESCTGGLLTARLTDPPGASEYVRGGVVVYSNAAKVAQLGVSRALIERHGAVSEQVAKALAHGVRERLDADVGVGITGIAGPGGGSEEKPVGLVWLSVVCGQEDLELTRSVRLPGGRADVRERSTTVAMHLLRRVLLGGSDAHSPD